VVLAMSTRTLRAELIGLLRKEVDRRKLTNLQLARRAKMHPRTIRRLWRNQVGIDIIERVFDALLLTVDVSQAVLVPLPADALCDVPDLVSR
jgi:hypothetical protein